eukprot:Hpha_TRINITY_DN2366_c0_g1::TRINITY_DN2366_c0_g1_i1::g.331::m.331
MADADDPTPPIENLQAESALAKKIQEEIKRKLTNEYSTSGTEETLQTVLPEYIKVLVCNGKPRSAVVEDLGLFLQDKAGGFVDWLWKMLGDLNPERAHSAFPAGGEGQLEVDKAPQALPSEPAAAKRPTGRRLRRLLEGDRKRTRSRAADAMASTKGFRDAIQTVADETRPQPTAPRRRLRARDPERAAKLRSEWEEMRAREERAGGDRDLLAPAPAAQADTKFTITMNNVGPQDIPSIAHYDDVPPRSLPFLMGVPNTAAPPVPGTSSETIHLAQQLQAMLQGGGGYPPAGGFEAEWAPPYKGGKGGGKGYYKGGSKGTVFGGGKGTGASPHMVFVRGQGGGDEVPAAKRPRAAPPVPSGPPASAGKGAFRHMVWQPGMKSEPAPNVARGGHKVWVNPASKAGAAAAGDGPGGAMAEDKA